MLIVIFASSMSAMTVLGEPDTRGSISIDGDVDLTSINGVTGGSGTSSDPFVIEGWDISGPGSTCIEVSNTRAHVRIEACLLTNTTGAGTGILLTNVTNCTIVSVGTLGLAHGIRIERSTDVDIRDCSLSKGYIYLTGSQRVAISNISVTDTSYGVYVRDSEGVSVTGSHISSLSRSGLYIGESGGIEVIGNEFRNVAQTAIRIYQTSNGQSHVQVKDNTIDVCRGSISVSSLDDVVIENNTATNNTGTGVNVWRCTSTTIRNNSMDDWGIFLGAETLEEAVSDFSGNTVGGRPIAYHLDETAPPVDHRAGQVILVNCTDALFEVQAIEDVFYPVGLYYCTNVSVSGSDLSNGIVGVRVLHGSRNRVEDCVIANYSIGVQLLNSPQAEVTNCSIVDCIEGIEPILSNDTSITLNEITGCSDGIGKSGPPSDPGSNVELKGNS